MNSQEILLKREESQETIRKFYQSNEVCDAQLWSYIDVQRSLVKFKAQKCSLKCKYTICNCKMSFHKVRVKFNHAECESELQMPSYMHCSNVWILIISYVATGCKYHGGYGV